MSFLVCEAAQRLKKNFLIQLDQLIDLDSLRHKGWGIWVAQAVWSPEAYDPLKIFKALVV